MLSLCRLQVQAAYLVGQPLRTEHLEPASAAQQVGLQVVGGSQCQLEVGVVVGLGNQALGVVQWQVAHGELLASVGPDDDALRRCAVARHHAEAFAEVVGGIEVGVDGEASSGRLEPLDAVQGQHAHLAVGAPGQQVPSLPRQFQAVRLHGVAVNLSGLVGLVLYVDGATLPHGLHQLLQHLAVAVDALDEYALLHVHALADDVADGERLQQPVLHAVAVQHVFVAYIVAVVVVQVALYVESEHLLDGGLVAQEGVAQHGLAAAHVGVYPPLVQLGQCDAVRCAADGVDEPDVGPEDIVLFHIPTAKLQLFSEKTRCLHHKMMQPATNFASVIRI